VDYGSGGVERDAEDLLQHTAGARCDGTDQRYATTE
jgi:hypothetical protein